MGGSEPVIKLSVHRRINWRQVATKKAQAEWRDTARLIDENRTSDRKLFPKHAGPAQSTDEIQYQLANKARMSLNNKNKWSGSVGESSIP